MRPTTALYFALLSMTLASYSCGGGGASSVATATLSAAATATITPTVTPAPSGEPKRLVIPSIDIDAPAVPLGLTRDNALDMPKDSLNVGWYKLPGYGVPGKAGNSLWAGYQGTTFNKLPNITVESDVYVTTESGGRYRYIVLGTKTYTPENIPMGEIIDPPTRPASEEWLTMITSSRIAENNATTEFIVVTAKRAD